MKMVALDEHAETLGGISWEKMSGLGNLVLNERCTADEVDALISDADIIFTTKIPITSENMQRAKNLKLIQAMATGYNIIDIDAAAKLGIAVCNVPSYSTEPVAQHTFSLILELCNHVGGYSSDAKSGRWAKSPDFSYIDYPLTELYGKTIGIIGYGAIGRRVGEIANAFGMRVLYTKRTKPDNEKNGARYAELSELLAKSDIISLNCALTADTNKLINKTSIAAMKKGAMVVNTARGGIVDETALASALNSGYLAGAAVDVLSTEPPQEDNPLLRANNCIVTPHIAWATLDSRRRLMDIATENVRAFIEGNPRNVVNGL
ncbi:MAG: D-2-hydroxyacid dehydrogenase [Oscillospiraceae bacterium]